MKPSNRCCLRYSVSLSTAFRHENSARCRRQPCARPDSIYRAEFVVGNALRKPITGDVLHNDHLSYVTPIRPLTPLHKTMNRPLGVCCTCLYSSELTGAASHRAMYALRGGRFDCHSRLCHDSTFHTRNARAVINSGRAKLCQFAVVFMCNQLIPSSG